MNKLLEKGKYILKKGINADALKLIAFICMIIDHFAHYFVFLLPTPLYLACRIIGRISMPLFTYLIVQGFFYTKNYNNYLIRMTYFAFVTQFLYSMIYIINIVFVPQYTTNQAYSGNVLFTYTVLLIVLKVVHESYIVPKLSKKYNYFVRGAILLVLLIILTVIPMNYSIIVIIIGVGMYFIEKLKIIYNMKTQNFSLIRIDENKQKLIYISLIGLLLLSIAFNFSAIYLATLPALLPIYLYNHKVKQYKKKYFKYTFYILFPLQHVVLYSLALVVYKWIV